MRELYFKLKNDISYSIYMITYSYKDFDGIIHYLNVHLDKTDDELNIQKMETIKAKYAQFFIGFTNYESKPDPNRGWH